MDIRDTRRLGSWRRNYSHGDDAEGPFVWATYRERVLPVLGAALGYLAFGEFTREKNASDIAGTAASAINLKDPEANAACNNALAAWDTSRPDSNKILTDAVKPP
jgi:hypothetical protein